MSAHPVPERVPPRIDRSRDETLSYALDDGRQTMIAASPSPSVRLGQLQPGAGRWRKRVSAPGSALERALPEPPSLTSWTVRQVLRQTGSSCIPFSRSAACRSTRCFADGKPFEQLGRDARRLRITRSRRAARRREREARSAQICGAGGRVRAHLPRLRPGSAAHTETVIRDVAADGAVLQRHREGCVEASALMRDTCASAQLVVTDLAVSNG
jgi:hypothetical protein